jgi:hypothetical protein
MKYVLHNKELINGKAQLQLFLQAIEKNLTFLKELEVRSKVLIKWNNLWKRFPWILKKKTNSDKVKEEMSTVFKTNLV